MQKSISFRAAILLGFVLPATVSASVMGSYNNVTISGKITQATTPTVTESGAMLLTVSKLASRSITNATVLDAMIQAGLLQTKTGYKLMERLQSGGTSEGFFAVNSKTDSVIAIPDEILSKVLVSEPVGAGAYSKTAKRTNQINLTSESMNFVYVGSGSLLSAPVSTYLTGSINLITRNYCRTASYTAVLRGALGENQVVDAKIVSKNASFIDYPPSSDSGSGGSGVIIINLPAGP